MSANWERPAEPYVPHPEQAALMPEVSGNTVNGMGDPDRRPPFPIYHHLDPDVTPFGGLQRWFMDRVAEHTGGRQLPPLEALPPVAETRKEAAPEEWAASIKAKGKELGCELIGMTRMRPEWVFENCDVPYEWIIMIGVAMDHESLRNAPGPSAVAEVIKQYGRGTKIARSLAGWLHERGWKADPHCGPGAGSVLLIPPAVECGFGELGKHGSIINRELGSSLRLAYVLTDLPLVADESDEFGADRFCTNCKLCSEACPPDAIFAEKQMVRGDTKWYVDFDKCMPYFNEAMGCAACLGVCPWARPDIASKLLEKFSRRRPD